MAIPFTLFIIIIVLNATLVKAGSGRQIGAIFDCTAPSDRLSLLMRLALYQPDIPQNTGTILRLAACMGRAVDIIEPAGFDLSDRALKRAALDYLPYVRIRRHDDFEQFQRAARSGGSRIILLSSRGKTPYTQFRFGENDILLLGRESAGVPHGVFEAIEHSVVIPIEAPLRSLNVAVAAAMVLGEAMRQVYWTGNSSASVKRD